VPYPSEHGDGDPSRVFPPGSEPQPEGSEDAGPHEFPSLEAICDLNHTIHEADGYPERYALLERSTLTGTLGRARLAYRPSTRGVIAVAAALAHDIAEIQAFRDGNRRTAYFAAKAFLTANGCGDLSVSDGDDHMLARYLNQVVLNQARGRPTPSTKQFVELFERRLARRWERKPRSWWRRRRRRGAPRDPRT
jgi:prophage maintenance system killer protein